MSKLTLVSNFKTVVLYTTEVNALKASLAAADEGADIWPQIAGRATGLLSGHHTTYSLFDAFPAYRELKARNLSDEEIRGVAKTGGVIGIGYWDGAICSTDPRAAAPPSSTRPSSAGGARRWCVVLVVAAVAHLALRVVWPVLATDALVSLPSVPMSVVQSVIPISAAPDPEPGRGLGSRPEPGRRRRERRGPVDRKSVV